MAGLRSVCLLLEKHRDVICEDLNVDQVVPELVSKGILGVEEEKALVNEALGRPKAELLINQLSKKGFAAFQEFCHVLEKSHPHLLTCFLMDVAAMNSATSGVSSGGDPESLKSLDVITRERDRVVQELNELRGTLTKRTVNKRDLNVNSSPPGPEPPDGDGGPPSYLELLASGGTTSSTAGSGGGSELSDEPLTEVLEEPVTEEMDGERVVWEYHHVSLNRVPGYGFGIAVSGGRDNPHFTTGDPSIAISDVLKSGPAEGRLHVNDRVLSANGVSLENVDYVTAVQVLKESGAVVRLYIKRRVVVPGRRGPQTLAVTLTKPRKKADFGVVLGCQIFVKEVAVPDGEGESALQPGDVVLSVNQHTTDGLSLKEVRRLMEAAKERVHLLVRREPAGGGAAPTDADNDESPHHVRQSSDVRSNYGAENVYVQPPTRSGRPDSRSQSVPPEPIYDRKNNLSRQQMARSRGPLTEAVLSQLEPSLGSFACHIQEPPPPRPPLPRDTVDRPLTNGATSVHQLTDIYESKRQLGGNPQSPKLKPNLPDPRFVSFQKEGSLGIRLTGGNETGIFVTAVQPASPAANRGLKPGDKIIKVNGMEMKGVTREEAVLFLLSVQHQIDLIVQYRAEEHDRITAAQRGDSFYVRTHFNYEQQDPGELSFRKGDVFHVVDTLNMGVVGAWQVFRIGRTNDETQKGVIPNQRRAEQLAAAQRQREAGPESRGRFFTRRRRQSRSKSLGKEHWEELALSDAISRQPAYERVALRPAGFARPVVLFGCVADVGRRLLLQQSPDRFAAPQLDMGDDWKTGSSGIIRLSAIRRLVEQGRHALLDVTPHAVDRLNYAQMPPICILLRADSKQIVKEVRSAHASDRLQGKSSKKIFEQCVKLERMWSHLFTATITVTDADGWYSKVRELIDRQQSAPIWMSETKQSESQSDDFLFPMTSRVSYASSPDSDTEGGDPAAAAEEAPPAGNSGEARLGRSSSDPNLAADDTPPPPPYSLHSQDGPAVPADPGGGRYGSGGGASVGAYQTLPHQFRTGGRRSPSGTRSYGRVSGAQVTAGAAAAAETDEATYVAAPARYATLDRIRTSNYDSLPCDAGGRFSNMHDDLKALGRGPRSLPAREVSEPPLSPGHAGGRPARYGRTGGGDRPSSTGANSSAADGRPLLPAGSAYKPVPPPKPKSYRLSAGGESSLRRQAGEPDSAASSAFQLYRRPPQPYVTHGDR